MKTEQNKQEKFKPLNIFLKVILLNYKSFHFRPSSHHSHYSLSSSLSIPKSSQGFLPCGKFRFLPPPSRSRKVSIQTDWIPKIQYMQRKVPVSLSMAFQKDSLPATFRESGWITCSFSPSPTGLGELSLDQSPCISG